MMLFAVIAIGQDWENTCGEMMHTYGAACILMCLVDMGLELVRCSFESTLDRLQANFQPGTGAGSPVNEGLLDGSSITDGFGQAVITSAEATEMTPSGTAGSVTSGALGRGVGKMKELQKRRVSNLHFWSIVFAVMVSIVFSFFSAHDEECYERTPSLYSYIHIFTYAFTLRLGVVILFLCCRTVQNYEDSASFALAARQQAAAGQPLSF
uniref:Transmembrane protein n=1 Tax=Alexandrium andersonii TaxID=327968 RepID=A0A7S2IQR8_9DINO